MPFSLEWAWWIAQIIIDIVLLVALFVLLGRQKKGKPLGQAPLAAEDFVEQAGLLAREFDRLLAEKRELVGTTLATLDARIDELRAMLEQTRTLQEKVKNQKNHSTNSHSVAAVTPAVKAKPYVMPVADVEEDPFQLPPGHPLNQIKEHKEEEVNSEQDFRGQVMQMFSQGKSSQEIANATGRPRAEVELLIALIK